MFYSYNYVYFKWFVIFSEGELDKVIQEIIKSEGLETFQKSITDGSTIASVFVGRDTRYVPIYIKIGISIKEYSAF